MSPAAFSSSNLGLKIGMMEGSGNDVRRGREMDAQSLANVESVCASERLWEIDIESAVLPHPKVVNWMTMFGVSSGRPSRESASGVVGMSSFDRSDEISHIGFPVLRSSALGRKSERQFGETASTKGVPISLEEL